MNRVPCANPSPEADNRPDDPKVSELMVNRPKATFQWPPDCLWPFMEQAKRAREE
jgi:hypothetical protein